ncbi:MAG TPA: hypothetical protein DDW52_24245 [Planctomycetaceae bacterium]|nr:hypothetical protein [Planctomycetaceae bacterium]
MSEAGLPPKSTDSIDVPHSLREQLGQFRKHVWFTKIGESVAYAVVALLLAYLTVYAVDRFVDTPASARGFLLALAVITWLLIPWAIHRWGWKNRRLEQLARLLRLREPGVGDQLLSVIELAGDVQEQRRSRTLVAAAIGQVADTAKNRDLRQSAPPNRITVLLCVMAFASVAVAVVLLLFPDAATNAWARLSAPWRATPRYTFTMPQPLPAEIIVPHGESTTFEVTLRSESPWNPSNATYAIPGHGAKTVAFADDAYILELPALTSGKTMALSIGDFKQSIALTPKHRPQITDAVAVVQLPDYLQQPEPFEQDIRSGVLAVVEGSQASFQLSASNPLASAYAKQVAPTSDQSGVTNDVDVDQNGLQTEPFLVSSDSPPVTVGWTDVDGLDGRSQFEVRLESLPDEFPSVLAKGLPKQSVVLDTEQLNFEVYAADDFGVRKIGMSWSSVSEEALESSALGEIVLGAGNPTQMNVQLPAVFRASDLGIEPQPIEVRFWVEDYYPLRDRTYSLPHLLYVLTAEQHAAWVSEDFRKWQRAALEVRDQELQLFEENKRLRRIASDPERLDELQDDLRRQAALESGNARRLSALTTSGEQLLQAAARNPEFSADQLDQWAQMLQSLRAIGNNRMPKVSDLLKKSAAQAKNGKKQSASESSPSAGIMRDTSGGQGESSEQDEKEKNDGPGTPSLVDQESSMQKIDAEESDEEQDGKKEKSSGQARLTMPSTTLSGPPQKPGETEDNEDEPDQPEGAEEALEEAVEEQERLLEEFQKLADELEDVLANLEGSTLVKRLKAASRVQTQIARKLVGRIGDIFGASSIHEADVELLQELATHEVDARQSLSFVMDDLQAYYERRKQPHFLSVLEDMKEVDVLAALDDLSTDLPKERGLSIAQIEYWADNLDRWAEDLVPASGGDSEGESSQENSKSVPPTVILEMLRVLEEEVNLREATRVTENARQSIPRDKHEQKSRELSATQRELQTRVQDVITKLHELVEQDGEYGQEIGLFNQVTMVMEEAALMLQAANTGSETIAAETEIIELLLKSSRINPKAGGSGSAANPGQGGSGTTEESALALVGTGINRNERREARDITQSTGETGRSLPEEYRGGLDAYFSRLEEAQR